MKRDDDHVCQADENGAYSVRLDVHSRFREIRAREFIALHGFSIVKEPVVFNALLESPPAESRLRD